MVQNEMSIRVLVADDNDLVRSGLCALLQQHQGWLVCAEAKNGNEAIERAKELKPDVALVDVSMPDLNGFEVATRIHEESPNSSILMVTEQDARTLAHMERQPGVRGYVMKSRLRRDLVPAIEAAIESDHLSASASA